MSDRLPVLKAKEVVRILERAGFYIHHQRGSHARLLHRTKPELHVEDRKSFCDPLVQAAKGAAAMGAVRSTRTVE